MEERCEHCGVLLSRPGLFRCKKAAHPAPDLAQRIVAEIERDLRDRRGLRSEWEAIDDEILDEIRDKWAALIRKELGR